MTQRRDGQSRDDRITVSVVIPVYNAASHLQRCLQALSRSTYDRYECIVVDDGSTDDSREVAERHNARVIALPGNRGPSYARNRGAEAATGDVLLFIDADVCVHPKTVAAAVAAFEREPELAAVIGSYDDRPADPTFFSQYKNLFHHYFHQRSGVKASTFWSGCGAVRRRLFLEMGGFNEGYSQACIEDIEFGFRLRSLGYHVRLDRTIQATHLKRWRFGNMVMTDLFRRGVPWIALMLRDRQQVHDLNLSWHSRVGTVLTYLLVLSLLMLAATGHVTATLPILGALGLGVLTALSYDRVRADTLPRYSLAGMAALGPVVWAADGGGTLALLPISVLMAILGIHHSFYLFFARARGPYFAFAVIPFHLLFFLYSGLAIPLGVLAHARDRRQAAKWGTGPATIPCRPLEPERPNVSPVEERIPPGQSVGTGLRIGHERGRDADE